MHTHQSELLQVVSTNETQHECDDTAAVEGERDETMVDYERGQEVLKRKNKSIKWLFESH